MKIGSGGLGLVLETYPHFLGRILIVSHQYRKKMSIEF